MLCSAFTTKGVRCKSKANENGFCKRHSNKIKTTFTITFGDVAINHIGMEKIGFITQEGFSLENLDSFRSKFAPPFDQFVQIYNLSSLSGIDLKEEAYLLVIRKFCQLVGSSEKLLYEELDSLKWDDKFFSKRHGRVVKKHARHNLCFANYDQNESFENQKGTVVSFDRTPQLLALKSFLEELLGINNLVAEGNKYYDNNKCGIGYHGDSERRKVIGLRLSNSSDQYPLCYQWFYKGEAIGYNMKFELGSGDLYIMSEKTVGFDWHDSSIPTLRHAAGSEKYIQRS